MAAGLLFFFEGDACVVDDGAFGRLVFFFLGAPGTLGCAAAEGGVATTGAAGTAGCDGWAAGAGLPVLAVFFFLILGAAAGAAAATIAGAGRCLH